YGLAKYVAELEGLDHGGGVLDLSGRADDRGLPEGLDPIARADRLHQRADQDLAKLGHHFLDRRHQVLDIAHAGPGGGDAGGGAAQLPGVLPRPAALVAQLFRIDDELPDPHERFPLPPPAAIPPGPARTVKETRRLQWRTNIALALALAASAAFAAPVHAGSGTLVLPPEHAALASAIASLCPACVEPGFAACGTGDIGYGKRFASHFLAGTPGRGSLPGFGWSGEEFKRLARSPERNAVIEALRQRFASVPLVIVEDDFAPARLIDAPAEVSVVFPEKLHACLR